MWKSQCSTALCRGASIASILGWRHIWMEYTNSPGGGCEAVATIWGWTLTQPIQAAPGSVLLASSMYSTGHPHPPTPTDLDTTKHDFLPLCRLISLCQCGCDIAFVPPYPLQLARWPAAAPHPTPSLNSALILKLSLHDEETTRSHSLSIVLYIQLLWCVLVWWGTVASCSECMWLDVFQ